VHRITKFVFRRAYLATNLNIALRDRGFRMRFACCFSKSGQPKASTLPRRLSQARALRCLSDTACILLASAGICIQRRETIGRVAGSRWAASQRC
jgi:hypothetical protein